MSERTKAGRGTASRGAGGLSLWFWKARLAAWPLQNEERIALVAWLLTGATVCLVSWYCLVHRQELDPSRSHLLVATFIVCSGVLAGIWLMKAVIWPHEKHGRISAVAWLGTVEVVLVFGCYYLFHDEEFKAAKPHELGSILQGWTAVLAAIWLAATVYLQGLQMRETAAGMRRSIEEIERNAFDSQVRPLRSRLFFAMRRLVKMCGDSDCYLSQGEERTSIVEKTGNLNELEELAEADELGEACARTCDGFAAVKGMLEADWLLHEEIDVVRRLIEELDKMTVIARGLRGMSERAALIGRLESIPDCATLDIFIVTTSALKECLDKMVAVVSELDNGMPGEGAKTDPESARKAILLS